MVDHYGKRLHEVLKQYSPFIGEIDNKALKGILGKIPTYFEHDTYFRYKCIPYVSPQAAAAVIEALRCKGIRATQAESHVRIRYWWTFGNFNTEFNMLCKEYVDLLEEYGDDPWWDIKRSCIFCSEKYVTIHPTQESRELTQSVDSYDT